MCVCVLLCAQNIAGEMFKGLNIQNTLNYAMQQINGLDTLIVGCAAGANTTEGYVPVVSS
jgi:hypothetical protein